MASRKLVEGDAPNMGSERIRSRLKRDVFPWIGNEPITELTAPKLLSVVQRIEERGALETAHRTLGTCGKVFRYAVATGRAERDPSGDLRGGWELGRLRRLDRYLFHVDSAALPQKAIFD